MDQEGADPRSDLLYTTQEEPELEPGSRIVSDAEVKAATGAEKVGWQDAAKKEYLESFMEMGAVATASPCDIARVGGYGKALPMKVVWTQKPEKEKCRAVVCGNFEEKSQPNRSGQLKQRPRQSWRVSAFLSFNTGPSANWT